MSRIYLGLICGLVFGGLDSAMMLLSVFPTSELPFLARSLHALALDL